MREAIIRFIDDNNVIRDLDENKYYYLTEADETLERVKKSVQQNNWSYTEKKFDFYMNGVYLMQGTYLINSNEELSTQIYNIIKNNKSIESEKKSVLLSQFKEAISEEKRLFSNRELKYFCIELSKIMGKRKVFLFSLRQTEKLFSSIQLKMRESMFSKMEDIKKAIDKSFDLLMAYEDLWHGSYDEIHTRLERWFAFEDNFNKYKNLFVAFFFSVPESRMNSLLRKSTTYKKLEYYLFEICAKQNFYESMRKQKEFERNLQRRRTEVLIEGVALQNDEILQNKVIDYTVRQFFINEKNLDGLSSSAHRFCEAYLNPERKYMYE
ncbi:hypothetical protein [Heyndrickxia ginsengihumi]|uniref:hypothetical protein n=1 Tax=Heyndrickxia ginsengihumi TaxID=363870 RepID=UPI00046E8761|nr:hypothetical protein [Heyndrickxia ginsengihumi]